MRKGEICLVRLDPTVGDEIGKTRPVVVVSDDEVGILRLKVIVPITGWNDLFSPLDWMVQLEPTSETDLAKLSADGTIFFPHLIGWCSSNRHQKMAWRNSPPPTLFKSVPFPKKDLSGNSEPCPRQLWKKLQKH